MSWLVEPSKSLAVIFDLVHKIKQCKDFPMHRDPENAKSVQVLWKITIAIFMHAVLLIL